MLKPFSDGTVPETPAGTRRYGSRACATISRVSARASELRANIQAIEKNNQAAAQRQKWTKQLDEFSTEGNKLGAQLAELEAKRLDARSELSDLIQELDVTAPSPAKKP